MAQSLHKSKSWGDRNSLPAEKTVVVKIGTSSVMHESGAYLALSTLAALVETLVTLRKQGYRMILVTSGAVGVGCQRLGLTERPKELSKKQAVAAVGQGRLMRTYDDLFTSIGQPIAQVLLTRENLGSETSYMNARNTFVECLNMGVIPIVNENDTVATEELRFGDNDTLSALVASLVDADWLFLLTDVPCMYSADPRIDKDAQPIYEVKDMSELPRLLTSPPTSDGAAAGATTGTKWGTGGMATKLVAAELATSAGVRTVICLGREPKNVERILDGEERLGTQFLPKQRPIRGHKRWIAQGMIPRGTITLDNGAAEAVHQKKNLFAAGITAVQGDFYAFSGVRICDLAGKEIARGLVNYSSEDLLKIKGRHSSDFSQLLGYEASEAVVERGNMELIDTYQSNHR